ncbi:unnamed protein product [Cuscuta epithymum]|uniref:Uncharacterized protein n=1 Tax=Cuscuta epithymum TaxID=186058 RepID=A0AAV0ETB4_9ASTE|nr:unnamed protein product [Cuscuta epithymum]
MSGAGMKRFTPESEFEVGQQFDNKEQVINITSLYSIKGCLNPFVTVIIPRITMDLILCTIHPCFGLREDLSPHVLRMRWMKVPEERLDVENVNKLAIIGPHVRRDHQEMKGGPLGMEVSADPGPSDRSVLTLQATHKSEDVWRGLDVQVDRCREHLRGLSHVQVDDIVLAYVRAAGFYGLHRLVATVPLDRVLFTAL